MCPSTPEPMLVLLLALALDLTCGEPPDRLHPVVWIGALTTALVRLAPARGPGRQLAAGAGIALLVPLVACGLSWALLAALAAARPSSPLAALPALAVATLLCKSSFSLRGLGRAAGAVRDALTGGQLAAARHALRSLCSRDPERLDQPQVLAAAIESVAENASDSFVAPLFYYLLFGVPGALFYRAVNTLDAMIGYRGRYEYLGKSAARLDDLLNLIPARLTAALLLAAGWLRGHSARRAWRVLRRDGARTESPNAGRPMAVMAGLLGVPLEKPGHYRLGDATRPLTAPCLAEAWRITGVAAALAVLLACLFLGVDHVASF
jgi:adenosylcobinamide-phosphate synthase